MLRIACLTLSALAVAGCGQVASDPHEDLLRPTIAVARFDNRAPFPMNWKIGDGVQDLLVDRLVATKRFQVVERPDLDAVLSELRLQQSGATREQNRQTPGRLKNVQYLVKGSVIDFGHVSSISAFAQAFEWAGAGETHRAVMSVTLQVIEVESGEIILSETVEQSVRASDLSVKAVYKDMAFGGSSFYKTPLGRATRKVLDKAVRGVGKSIAARPWTPKVAQVTEAGSVLVNGGRDRRLKVGQEFNVLQPGEEILDPDSGDLLGRHPGRQLARILIEDVRLRYSVGCVLDGKPETIPVGAVCRPVEPIDLAAR